MRFESIRGQKRIRQVGVSSEKSNGTEPSFFALTTKLNHRDETKFSRTTEFSKKCGVRNPRNNILLDQLTQDEDKETES